MTVHAARSTTFRSGKVPRIVTHLPPATRQGTADRVRHGSRLERRRRLLGVGCGVAASDGCSEVSTVNGMSVIGTSSRRGTPIEAAINRRSQAHELAGSRGGGGAINLVMHLAEAGFCTAMEWLEQHLLIRVNSGVALWPPAVSRRLPSLFSIAARDLCDPLSSDIAIGTLTVAPKREILRRLWFRSLPGS